MSNRPLKFITFFKVEKIIHTMNPNKLVSVIQKFITKVEDILHKTSVNRDINEILKLTHKLLSKRTQEKKMLR